WWVSPASCNSSAISLFGSSMVLPSFGGPATTTTCTSSSAGGTTGSARTPAEAGRRGRLCSGRFFTMLRGRAGDHFVERGDHRRGGRDSGRRGRPGRAVVAAPPAIRRGRRGLGAGHRPGRG